MSENFICDDLAYANKTQRRMVSAAIGTVLVQEMSPTGILEPLRDRRIGAAGPAKAH